MDCPLIDSTLYARQRIFDRELRPAGEELLYRERPYPNRAPARFDPDRATSRVLVNAFMRDPRSSFNAQQPAFVNFSAATLARRLPCPPDRLVVEVLESVRPSDTVRRHLDRLKARGFRIALDDYTRRDAAHPLIDYADIVKLEYPAFGPAGLKTVTARLKQRNPDLCVLAEKIETTRDVTQARAAGCDLLQGYALHKPEPVFAPVPAIVPAQIRALGALAYARRNDQHLARELARHPALATLLGRLAQHWRPASAGEPSSPRHTLAVITPQGIQPALDLIEATLPTRYRAYRRRMAPAGPGTPLRDTLAELRQYLARQRALQR